jgi:hypothetical protein
VTQGTGRARKVRWKQERQGKRGGMGLFTVFEQKNLESNKPLWYFDYK